jgi:hypothetical protein
MSISEYFIFENQINSILPELNPASRLQTGMGIIVFSKMSVEN